MKKLLSMLFIVIPFIIFSQVTSGNINFAEPGGRVNAIQTKNRSLSGVKAKGTPFINDNFEFGEIYVNGKLEAKSKLRYNAYTNEIEVLNYDDSSYILLKRSYVSAIIDGKLFKIIPYVYSSAKSLKTNYFNPLNGGELVLLFRPRIKLKKGKVPTTSYGRVEPPTYQNISSYYVQKGDEPAKELRLSKKDVIRLLDKSKISVVSQYIKNENLNLKKEYDVIRLLNFYNNL